MVNIYNKEGKIIGEVKNNIYFTTRDPSKHYMRKFKGYGISTFVLKELYEMGCHTIVINTADKNYQFKLKEYMDSDLKYIYNDDLQKFVSISEDILRSIKTLDNFYL